MILGDDGLERMGCVKGYSRRLTALWAEAEVNKGSRHQRFLNEATLGCRSEVWLPRLCGR